MKSKLLFLLTLTASLGPLALRAEEAGSGHYLSGATASFIDALPGKEAFAYVNAFTYYNGSVGGSRRLELGGNIAANIEGTVYADASIFLYQTPWHFLGGQYAAGLAVPYIWMEVKADVQRAGLLGGTQTVQERDTASGFGDIQVIPFMLGWTNGDLKWDGRFSFYAPSGDYTKGQIANVGKNYWTFEPGGSISYLSSKIGLELSAFAGFDFNTKNEATDYQTGTQFHLDATVAQHLPLLGGFAGVGANAFFYQQISGDSGAGAKLGDFEGRTVGIGPVISYAAKIGAVDLVAEVKWLPELDVQNRLKGDTIWFKLAALF